MVQGCRKRGKPVIVATNMLESMIENPAPTRAEVSDISIAVREGSDAVMLSGETAYGEHPMKSMQTMSIVAKRTEFRCDEPYRRRHGEHVVPINYVCTCCTATLHLSVSVAEGAWHDPRPAVCRCGGMGVESNRVGTGRCPQLVGG